MSSEQLSRILLFDEPTKSCYSKKSRPLFISLIADTKTPLTNVSNNESQVISSHAILYNNSDRGQEPGDSDSSVVLTTQVLTR